MSRAAHNGFETPSSHFPTDALHIGLFVLHAAIVGYVLFGWAIPSRNALFAYVLLLPLIMMQWLLNGGSSVVNNFETLLRTGRWRDPRNGLEGTFFQNVLSSVGIDATNAQINTVAVFAMLLFWMTAMFRMVMIVAPM